MSIAKGKVYIAKEKLSELFRLPEGVEVLSVKVSDFDGSLEFLVVSAEETKVTRKDIDINNMRRVSVNELEIDYLKERQYNSAFGFGDMSDLVLILPEDERKSKLISPMWQGASIKSNDSVTIGNTISGAISNVNKPIVEDVKELFEEVLKNMNKKGINTR